MTGVVQGGWEFVIAAYAVTATALAAYGASVFFRLRAEQQRGRRAAERVR
jgi:hypothetical protein